MSIARPQGSICVLPRLEGLGGPASFRARLAAGLQQRGIGVHQNPADPTCRAVLVIGGTRRLDELIRARRRGLPIVQRLNGMNWLHRRVRTGLKHYLRSETNNFLLAFIRRWLASRIVYQSEFSRDWWQRVYGPVGAGGSVVYNGIDLEQFQPGGPGQPPDGCERLLLVEGRLGGGYEIGLENAIGLAQRLARLRPQGLELMVAGDAPASLRARSEERAPGLVRWRGVVRRDEIPELDRSAHLFFSADLNAACPNSVVEALACGLPVVAFATGALAEMVTPAAGRVVPWGSDHWKLEPPDLDGLARGASEVLDGLADFRRGARARAEAAFGLDAMVEGYLAALLG